MEELKGGLLPLPKDKRDFSLTKVFGAIDISEIPDDDFVVADPLGIKEQYNTDMCLGFAACAVSEDQEKVLLSPEYFFAQIKKIMGDWRSWGADLRSTCKAAIKIGFLEEKLSPYNLKEKNRDFVANWENWSFVLDKNAKEHAKESYFAVDGYQDRFSAFRAALWVNRKESRSILTGVRWKLGWMEAKDGIISKEAGTPMMGHSLKIFGQKRINNELYLVAQLSNGVEVGDKGIFYFPREVINRDFTFGAYMFKDMPAKEAKKISWSWGRRIWEIIKKVFKYWINEFLK